MDEKFEKSYIHEFIFKITYLHNIGPNLISHYLKFEFTQIIVLKILYSYNKQAYKTPLAFFKSQ